MIKMVAAPAQPTMAQATGTDSAAAAAAVRWITTIPTAPPTAHQDELET